MPTIEVMPMTTPSTVSADRILLPASVSSAIAAVSRSSARLLGESAHLFPPQRFDRIQHGGAAGRIPAEEQADDAR